MQSSFSVNKHMAIESFRTSLWQARRDAFISKLTRKASCLKGFGAVEGDTVWQRRYVGLMNIPTKRITGTVGRQDDFDGRFRPLKAHLKERWVNVALRSWEAGWPPIEVIKAGEDYYVIDGHHRTSYARSSGMAFIDAEVWEMVKPSGANGAAPPHTPPPPKPAAQSPSINPAPGNGVLVVKAVDCCCCLVGSA